MKIGVIWVWTLHNEQFFCENIWLYLPHSTSINGPTVKCQNSVLFSRVCNNDVHGDETVCLSCGRRWDQHLAGARSSTTWRRSWRRVRKAPSMTTTSLWPARTWRTWVRTPATLEGSHSFSCLSLFPSLLRQHHTVQGQISLLFSFRQWRLEAHHFLCRCCGDISSTFMLGLHKQCHVTNLTNTNDSFCNCQSVSLGKTRPTLLEDLNTCHGQSH